MLIIALVTTAVLIVIITITLLRAVDYSHRHPELVTNATPISYHLCQLTLRRVIQRYHELAADSTGTHVEIAWHSPYGLIYTITDRGIQQRRGSSSQSILHALDWDDIGGVGVRMQPDFAFTDQDRDGSPDNQVTTGYSFSLLIVPFTGSTMNIRIPTDNQEDAVEFVAQTLLLAERRQKRINVFGFHKPPAPRRRRVSDI